MGFVSMRGRSLASSSSSMSEVLRLMHEQRSRDEKKAEATLVPNQLAIRSSFSYDMKLEFSIGLMAPVALEESEGFNSSFET